MAEIRRPRRYYLHQRIDALRCGETALAGAWRWKQEAQPGIGLPADFPKRSELVALGYTTIEDIDGADECELTDVGLSRSAASAILASPYLTATFLVTDSGAPLVTDAGAYLIEG